MATARKASRHTLIYLLRLAASSPKGLPRKQIIKNNLLAKELNRVQASHWEEKGLFGLLHEEILPTKGRSAKVFFITSAGRDFLAVLASILMRCPRLRQEDSHTKLEAKRYADKKNQQSTQTQTQSTEVLGKSRKPTIHGGSLRHSHRRLSLPSYWRKGMERTCHVVTKIRLLRQRVRQRALRERFIQIANEQEAS